MYNLQRRYKIHEFLCTWQHLAKFGETTNGNQRIHKGIYCFLVYLICIYSEINNPNRENVSKAPFFSNPCGTFTEITYI